MTPIEFPHWLTRVTPAWTWNWPHQRHIQAALEAVTRGELTRLMVFCPPRHGKSEMGTVRYPAYRLECEPATPIIIGAYNQTLADRFSRKCRRIVAGRIGVSTERSDVSDWETLAGGGVRAVGVGAGVTGHGGKLILIDDPVKSREEAESPTYRQRVWDWYTDDLYTRLEPGGAIILTMTRWHEDDLAGRILASDDAPNWTVISLPAEAEANDPLGRADGEPLCPDRFDSEALADIRRVLGSQSYNALYQQRPAPAEGGIIKRTWIMRYDRPPERFDQVIASWDMAFKDRTDSSYVVGQVWGRIGADCYLLDQVRERLDFPATQKAVIRLAAQWPQARKKLVEDKANGPAIIASLRHVVQGLVPVSVSGSKQARLEAVSPLFEAGNVWVPQSAPWVGDWIEELATFPNASNDDQVDACSQALEHVSKRGGKLIEFKDYL